VVDDCQPAGMGSVEDPAEAVTSWPTHAGSEGTLREHRRRHGRTRAVTCARPIPPACGISCPQLPPLTLGPRLVALW
jgi:hypothetical protein